MPDVGVGCNDVAEAQVTHVAGIQLYSEFYK